MDLLMILLVVVIVGFIVWLVTTNIPMPPVWATAIQVIALVVMLLWVLSKFVAIPNVLR